MITALTGITLTDTGIQAGVWTALAALVCAYVAGLTAVRASAPATHAAAALTGLVAGGLLVLLTTLFALNSASRLIGAAGNALGNVAGTAANAAGAARDQVAQSGGRQNLLSGVNQDAVVDLIAEDSPNLHQTQVRAAANVGPDIFRWAQYDLGNVSPANIGDFATARLNAIRQASTGDQFVTRLTRQGLSQAQAQEVRTSVTGQVNCLEQQATWLAGTAEATARTTARNTGLTLLLAVMGPAAPPPMPRLAA